MTVVLGIVYPLTMTGITQLLFPNQAHGSFVKVGDKVVGSTLIAQSFKDPKFFWPRPSAIDYNPVSSGASNLGPTSADLKSKIDDRRKQGLEGDLLYSSGSGLDPHIGPKSAEAQMERIAQARNFNQKQRQALIELVRTYTENRQFGFLGEPRVNVLKVNMALNSL